MPSINPGDNTHFTHKGDGDDAPPPTWRKLTIYDMVYDWDMDWLWRTYHRDSSSVIMTSSWRHHDVIIIMWDHLVTWRSWKYRHWKPDRIDPHTAPTQELSWMGSIDCIILYWSLYYCKKKLIHTTVERMTIKPEVPTKRKKQSQEPDDCVRLFMTIVVFHHR